MSKVNSNYARRENDSYNTPRGPLEALYSAYPMPPPGVAIFEPAAGGGGLVAELWERGHDVYTGDLATGQDFFALRDLPMNVGAIVTNPPFGDEGAAFARHALRLLARAAPPRLLCLLFPCDYDHAPVRRELFADCPNFMGQVKLQRRIVWFERDDGKRPAPSEWHSWYLWSKAPRTGEPWTRYAAWED